MFIRYGQYDLCIVPGITPTGGNVRFVPLSVKLPVIHQSHPLFVNMCLLFLSPFFVLAVYRYRHGNVKLQDGVRDAPASPQRPRNPVSQVFPHVPVTSGVAVVWPKKQVPVTSLPFISQSSSSHLSFSLSCFFFFFWSAAQEQQPNKQQTNRKQKEKDKERKKRVSPPRLDLLSFILSFVNSFFIFILPSSSHSSSINQAS